MNTHSIRDDTVLVYLWIQLTASSFYISVHCLLLHNSFFQDIYSTTWLQTLKYKSSIQHIHAKIENKFHFKVLFISWGVSFNPLYLISTFLFWRLVPVPSSARLKCPLQGTNKRFLLNTLRSTGLQRHTAEPTTGHSARRGRLRSESPEERRGRSRSPPREHRKNAGHTDHKHHHHRGKRNTEVKKPDRDWERSHRPDRGQAHSKDDQSTEQDKHWHHE